MPFGIPSAKVHHPDLQCHGCGQTFPHRHGTGLYCSAGCEGETKTRKAIEEEKLKAKGFEQHPDSPHTWIKDNVAIAIEQVIRSGHEETVQAHAEALQAIAADRNRLQAGN